MHINSRLAVHVDLTVQDDLHYFQFHLALAAFSSDMRAVRLVHLCRLTTSQHELDQEVENHTLQLLFFLLSFAMCFNSAHGVRRTEENSMWARTRYTLRHLVATCQLIGRRGIMSTPPLPSAS